MRIKLPPKVNFIISRLLENGFDAYAVGGCVRDSILGRTPDDWDITTSATPQQVKSIFERTIDTGIEHGTVTVMLEKEGFEVTTYRIDGEYKDSRHPEDVQFTDNLIEDLKRRDFTINAMAYNDIKGLVDAFDGKGDLERKIIRCVGCANDRFTEDALRMLRAIRFSAQLGFELDEETKQAIRQLAYRLNNISAERIQVELVKLMVSPNPWFIKKAYETGITEVIMPEFDKMMECQQNNPHHKYSVGEHTLKALEATPNDKVLRLTVLMHDIGKPFTKTTDEDNIDHFYNHADVSCEIAKRIFKRLKFDNDTTNKVCHLIKYHDYNIKEEKMVIRHVINKIGQEYFIPLMQVKRADTYGKSELLQKEKYEYIDKVEALFNEIINDGECTSLKMLAVSGNDIIDAKLAQGREVGKILDYLLKMVLNEPKLNQKEKLMVLARKKCNKEY